MFYFLIISQNQVTGVQNQVVAKTSTCVWRMVPQDFPRSNIMVHFILKLSYVLTISHTKIEYLFVCFL